MANSMKSNNAAIAVMQQMLQERCIAEPAFAIKTAQPRLPQGYTHEDSHAQRRIGADPDGQCGNGSQGI